MQLLEKLKSHMWLTFYVCWTLLLSGDKQNLVIPAGASPSAARGQASIRTRSLLVGAEIRAELERKDLGTFI